MESREKKMKQNETKPLKASQMVWSAQAEAAFAALQAHGHAHRPVANTEYAPRSVLGQIALYRLMKKTKSLKACG